MQYHHRKGNGGKGKNMKNIAFILCLSFSGCADFVGYMAAKHTQAGVATSVTKTATEIPKERLDYHQAIHSRTLETIGVIAQSNLPVKEKMVITKALVKTIDKANARANVAGSVSPFLKGAGIVAGSLSYQQAEEIANLMGQGAKEGINWLWGLLGLLLPAGYGGTRLGQYIVKTNKASRLMSRFIEEEVPSEKRVRLAKTALKAGVGDKLNKIKTEIGG